MGRNGAREFEERLQRDSLRGAEDDRAEERAGHRNQFDGGAARRSISFSLWRDEGRDYQLRERTLDGTGAAQHHGELRGARMGGHGHVEAGAEDQGGISIRNESDPTWPRGHG